VVRINQEYPNIGVQISQETEFDHREHEPLYTTLANADGSWKIENVTKGEYNVVAEKDSFGWRYDVDKSFQVNTHIHLKKQRIFEGSYSGANIEINNEFVIVNENTIINETTDLTFKGKNYIIFNNNKKLEIYGDLAIQEDAKLLFFLSDTASIAKIEFKNIQELNLKTFMSSILN
jgi:hypothetical protein